MRVAVAGAGAFGRNHLRVYRELEAAGQPVALVAAVEPDAARAAETAAKYAIPVFPTVDELLAARRASGLRVDAATVAVPTLHHHAVASALLDAGLDLLVEKPLAASLAEADDLIRAAQIGGRILQQVMRRIEADIEDRVNDALNDVLQKAIEGLARDLKQNLHQKLQEAIQAAVSEEISRVQTVKK